jgi:cell wall-associated NlpC family hydrolase
MKRLRLAKVAAKFVGAPYRLGGRSRNEGYDCLSLVLGLAEEWGIRIPEGFEGIEAGTYPAYWESDPESAKAMLIRFAASLGGEVLPHHAFAGDLLVLRPRLQPEIVILGLHAGGDLVLSAFTDLGVALLSLRLFRIEKAVRWARH